MLVRLFVGGLCLLSCQSLKISYGEEGEGFQDPEERDNELGAVGMAALAPALRSMPGLTTLDISCELGQLGRGRHLWAEKPGLGGDEEGR